MDACDAGRFSLYVSEDLRVHACSFQTGLSEGDLLDETTSLLDIWHRSPNMQKFRQYFASDRCGGCSHRSSCMNGCPIFEDLVICGNR
ncbi:SPASM domain-containing protein [Devosia sp.]|uniref:SPASM domain-containing protein n=1 Tax=Devosia sp. TaxID=1871048 RepID=UPI0039774090